MLTKTAGSTQQTNVAELASALTPVSPTPRLSSRLLICQLSELLFNLDQATICAGNLGYGVA